MQRLNRMFNDGYLLTVTAYSGGESYMMQSLKTNKR